MNLIQGDCVEVMAGMEENSVDAIVTDPPYGLEFMGKEWDRLGDVGKVSHAGTTASSGSRDRSLGAAFGRLGGVAHNGSSNRKCAECRKWEWDHEGRKCECKTPKFPNVKVHQGRLMHEWHQEWATQALRVLKPGGHLLAFGGTRTYHRLTCAIEDAGFEIRDCLAWLYGSGFPKSLDVSKAMDKANGNPLAWKRFAAAYGQAVKESGKPHAEIDRLLGIKSSSCYWARLDHRGGMPPRHHWEKVVRLLDLPADFARLYDEAEREVVGQQFNVANKNNENSGRYNWNTENQKRVESIDITAPSTPEAQQWNGWGTALKPAHEPIVLARKPLTGTVAQNVLEFSTGAINVDACRISSGQRPTLEAWENGKSLCGSCAEAAVKNGRHTAPASKGSTAQKPAELTTNGKGETPDLPLPHQADCGASSWSGGGDRGLLVLLGSRGLTLPRACGGHRWLGGRSLPIHKWE